MARNTLRRTGRSVAIGVVCVMIVLFVLLCIGVPRL